MSKSYQDFYDSSAGLALLSYIINTPSVLDDNQYSLNTDDFYTEIHRLMFRLVLAARQAGARVIDIQTIDNILSGLGAERAIWNSFNGNQLFAQLKAQPEIENFDYYYTKIKKDSLVRAMAQNGMDMSWLVPSETLIDAELKTRMERHYSELSLKELGEIIEQHFLYIRDSFLDNQSQVSTTYYIQEDYDTLFERLQEEPEMGLPLYGKYINTITRGARLGKLYIRSAASGVGKSRAMMADACMTAMSSYYDLNQGKWVSTGSAEPVVFISTELGKEELQTMATAFIAGVNEDLLLGGGLGFGEEAQRVEKAKSIIRKSKLIIEELPNFTTASIERVIKSAYFKHHSRMVFFDYLGTSLGVLEEMKSRTGTNLREDSVLFLIATRLKELAVEYNMFIMTATQLNAAYKTDPIPDQSLLRGAKSIADRVDMGMILLNSTQDDKEALQDFCDQNGIAVPDMKLSVYKNRRGAFTNAYLWINSNKGCCRFDPIFATTWDYEPIALKDIVPVIDGGEDSV